MLEKYIVLFWLLSFFIRRPKSYNALQCGLFGGISSTLSDQEKEVINRLGILSVFRGDDSSGVISVNNAWATKEAEVSVIKDVVPVTQLLSTNKDAIFSGRRTAIIGHARAKTIGTNTVGNAHPHRHKHIIGCHNGTINNFVKYGEDRSDSSVLFERLANEDLTEVLKDANRSGGAYALTWIDLQDNTLNFIRNDKRTLYLMYSSGNSTVYWSSEKDMLDFVDKRSSMVFKVPYLLAEHTLLSLNLNSISKKKVFDLESFLVSKPVSVVPMIAAKKEESKPESTFLPNFVTNPVIKEEKKAANDEYSVNVFATKATIVKFNNEKVARNPALVKSHKVSYAAYNGMLYPPAKMVNILNKGCELCGQPKRVIDKVFWPAENTFVCEECMKDPGSVEMYLTYYNGNNKFYEGFYPATTWEIKSEDMSQ